MNPNPRREEDLESFNQPLKYSSSLKILWNKTQHIGRKTGGGEKVLTGKLLSVNQSPYDQISGKAELLSCCQDSIWLFNIHEMCGLSNDFAGWKFGKAETQLLAFQIPL